MPDKVKVKARSNAITRRFEIDSSSSWDDLESQVSDCIHETRLIQVKNPIDCQWCLKISI